MRLKLNRRFAAIMMCALAVSSAMPAMPVYARNRTHASGTQTSSERKMRDAAGQVQKAFDKQDLNKLADLCSYPTAISFGDGSLVEVQNKQQFLALGTGTIFSRKMLDSIASTNTAKLTSVGNAGAQMGGDYGLTLYKIKGKWKINNFYLDASQNQGSSTSVNISSIAEMGEQIQKTFSYRDLDTLSQMCNYPMIITFSDGTSVEVQTPQGLIAYGESRIFTDKLLQAIDQTNVSGLKEVGSAGVQMGGDSGLNMYKFNGYWKINQIYQ